MAFDKSYPIRATISIVWKKEHTKLKVAFENNLRNDCEQFSSSRDKNKILNKLGIDKHFFKDYDLVGKITTTSQPSYIIKEGIGQSRTSFELFNDQQHIKEHVRFIRKELYKTIIEERKLRICFLWPYCTWEEHFSISNVNFEPPKFGSLMKSNIPILAGCAAPLSIFLYELISNITTNINSDTLRVAGIEIGIIFLLYILITVVMYYKQENVIIRL